MKKATVGMVMLVGLVLIKAYISVDERAQPVDLARDHSVFTEVIESNELRADHFSAGSSQSTLLAQNISQPNFEAFVTSSNSNQIPNNPVLQINDLAVQTVNPIINSEEDEEVVPMDYLSNTGYGLLKTTTEQIISKNDREGKEPLDNGSTISDNISKMFPRSN